jgi:signal transduction histidine kinase
VIAQQHHIVVDVHPAEVATVSHDVSLCLFRVAQEALNNAVRHGKATHISVSLSQATDVIRLEIRDDGIGFDPAMSSNGLGLTSMRARLRTVGGTLNLTSASGQGTLIEALVQKEGTTGG